MWAVPVWAAAVASAQVLPEIEDSIQKIAARASPAVWLVEAEPDPAKFKLTPAASSAYRYIKRGVAFAWDAEGLLITAHSVVSDTRGGTVTLAQRDRRLEAVIVGSDAETDTALLKVGTGQLSRVLPLGNSESTKAGAFALVLGPDLVPLRLSPGWVNHMEMRLPGYRESLLVVNTAVDAGAAGTPVIGSDGRVMGMVYAGGFGRPAVSWSLVHRTPNRTIINAVPEPQRRADGQQDFVVKMHVAGTAAGAIAGAAPGLQIQVKSDGTPQIVVHADGREAVVDALKLAAGGVEWMDIGFGNSPVTAMIGGSGPPTYVVPVDVIRGVLDDLKIRKQVRRGQMGVVLMDAVAGSGKPSGALVYRIVEGGPAERAGIKAGEVIVAAGGKTVADSGELIRCTRARRDGDSVELIVLAADGKTRTCTVKLASLSVWAAGEAGMPAPARSNSGPAVPKADTPAKPGQPRDNR